MSGGLDILSLKEEDITKMLLATTHLGSENVNFQMEQYVYKRRPDGVNIINLGKTWEKLVLAARAIAAIEHPQDVFVISSRPIGQRAVLKFAKYTDTTPIAGRFTPGAFTNQIQSAFREPRLLVVTDPLTDHQPIMEASYVNIPVIAFTNTDSPLRYIDIAIPCNNKSPHSIGLMWWLLSREVLRLRGTISRTVEWPLLSICSSTVILRKLRRKKLQLRNSCPHLRLKKLSIILSKKPPTGLKKLLPKLLAVMKIGMTILSNHHGVMMPRS